MTSLRRKRCTVAGRVAPPEDVDSQFGSENEAVEHRGGSGLMDTFSIGQEEVGNREHVWGREGGLLIPTSGMRQYGDKCRAPNDGQSSNSAVLVSITLRAKVFPFSSVLHGPHRVRSVDGVYRASLMPDKLRVGCCNVICVNVSRLSRRAQSHLMAIVRTNSFPLFVHS